MTLPLGPAGVSLARGPLAPARCQEIRVRCSQAQWELGFCLSVVSPLMKFKSLNAQDRKRCFRKNLEENVWIKRKPGVEAAPRSGRRLADTL